MRPVQTGIAGAPTSRQGAAGNRLRADIRSLAPRHVPGSYVSHTSEGVHTRPKAKQTDETPSTSSEIPRWG